MSDKIFFLEDVKNITAGKFYLNESESYHFLKVLRKSISAEIWLSDGIGTVYKAIVEDTANLRVSGTIVKQYPNYCENSFKMNLLC